jgi:hypothetical protein
LGNDLLLHQIEGGWLEFDVGFDVEDVVDEGDQSIECSTALIDLVVPWEVVLDLKGKSILEMIVVFFNGVDDCNKFVLQFALPEAEISNDILESVEDVLFAALVLGNCDSSIHLEVNYFSLTWVEFLHYWANGWLFVAISEYEEVQ